MPFSEGPHRGIQRVLTAQKCFITSPSILRRRDKVAIMSNAQALRRILWARAEEGAVVAVRALREHEMVDVNDVEDHGNTTLHLAC